MGGRPLMQRYPRRWLIQRGAVGAAIGSLWGAGLRATALPDVPTISVVGERRAQIVLLDAMGSRALILLGEPSTGLLERLPAMLTALRQRIDLIIGSESVLAGVAVDVAERWRARHTLIVPTWLGGPDSPDTARASLVRSDLELGLGGVKATMRISPRQEWRAGSSDSTDGPAWAVAVERETSRVLLSPTAAGTLIAGPRRPVLVITPGDDIRLVVEKISPLALAVNGDAVDESTRSRTLPLVRTFRDDVARFELGRDGVRLPPWAQLAAGGD